MPSIRLATASPHTQSTKAETLQLLSSLAAKAAANSADLLLLPEAFIGGYPRGTAFGCVIGERKDSGRDEYADYFAAAADLGDVVGDGNAGGGDRWVKRQLPISSYDAAAAGETGSSGKGRRGDGTREELERIARETGVFIVTGLIEKAGGSLYCSAVYVCPKEGIIGKRRKVMPTGTERLVWAQGCPSTLKAVSTTLKGTRVNLAAAICWESYMPLLRQTLYSQNINLYLAPTADGRDSWLSLMRTVGIEGRCFVVSANMAVPPHASTAIPSSRLAEGDGVPDRGRSAIAEEGDDTVADLPKTSPTRRRRRKSVFDDDGNEIVLCCPEDAAEETNGAAHPTGLNGKVAPLTKSSSAAAGGAWKSRGGSCIVNPYGDVLAGPQWEDNEGIVYADVDMRECIKGRLDFDAGGHYSRSDSFKFSVNGLDLEPLPY